MDILKKLKKISLLPIVAVSLLLILLVYYFQYMIPAQAEMNRLNTEIALLRAQAATVRGYINNSEGLQNEINSTLDEIEELNKNGYTNASNVNTVISRAIKENNITLRSIQLEKTTVSGNTEMLPIRIDFIGKSEDVFNFIEFFEKNTDGAYIVNSMQVENTSTYCTVSVVLHLCTPKK